MRVTWMASRTATVGRVVLLALSTACDGYLATSGRVYGSPDADSSRIYVDEPFPQIAGLVPLDSAVVWVFQRPEDRTSDTARRVRWSHRTVSGHCGFFSAGQAAPPHAFDALIQVRRAGFKDAVRRFRHGSTDSHRVMVILAPEAGTALDRRPRAPPCP